MREHSYRVDLAWTGNLGVGTEGYHAYSRSHEIHVRGKPTLAGSSDLAFKGSPERYNPEELLVAALSACHMLWYLHLCASEGVVVLSYEDHADGTMTEDPDGGGAFKEVVLKPLVRVSSVESLALAERLHDEAHRLCFIARSVNFEVRHLCTTILG